MSSTPYDCVFEIDIDKKLTPKSIEKIFELAGNAITNSNPKLEGKIAFVDTSLQHWHGVEMAIGELTGKKPKTTPALQLHVSVKAKKTHTERMMENAVPAINEALTAAGYKVLMVTAHRLAHCKVHIP